MTGLQDSLHKNWYFTETGSEKRYEEKPGGKNPPGYHLTFTLCSSFHKTTEQWMWTVWSGL